MRRLLEGVLWWAACAGMWLLTLPSVPSPELVAAMASAVPCAVLAVLARHAVQGRWHARPGWLRWLLVAPVAVATDTVRVLGLAAGVLVGRRIPAGDLRRVQLTRDAEPGLWAGRQAAAVGLVSLAPGTLPLDVDAGSGELLLHALGAGRPDLEQLVAR